MLSRILAISLFSVGCVFAQEFKAVNFTYEVGGNKKSNTIYIPHYGEGKDLPVRGVMQNVGGPLKQFAHDNQVAMIKGLDQGRGFSKELLAGAAKATNRPEIAYAGAIVQGISKGGRAAADWAAANQERAIAVILDHSAIWHMDFPKRVTGVPMFFNATYDNLYQNIDRRKSHAQWCSFAFPRGQACTAIIDHKKGGHGGRGSTDLTAVWLGEAMNLRVPINVPVGKPYKLINVDPTKTGAYVSVSLSMDGKRTYHDKVKISSDPKGASWWIPGPKSAAMYLQWVKEIGGTVVLDKSSEIKSFPIFINLPNDLKQTVSFIRVNQWAKAHTYLQKSNNPDGQVNQILARMINSDVMAHLAYLNKIKESGDIYRLFKTIKANMSKYRGIPVYDKKLTEYNEYFKEEDNAKNLKLGRMYYSTFEQLNVAKSVNPFMLNPLRDLAKKYPENIYGKAAKNAYLALYKDPKTANRSPQSYF